MVYSYILVLTSDISKSAFLKYDIAINMQMSTNYFFVSKYIDSWIIVHSNIWGGTMISQNSFDIFLTKSLRPASATLKNVHYDLFKLDFS